MFEEMEILNKNLQKGMERWLEQDLQHRGTLRQAHPELQNTEKVERPLPAQQ